MGCTLFWVKFGHAFAYFDDINEQDTSFLDCKHKHMMKSGAPPDKFGVLYSMVTYRIPWFHKQNNFKSYHSLVPGPISTF